MNYLRLHAVWQASIPSILDKSIQKLTWWLHWLSLSVDAQFEINVDRIALRLRKYARLNHDRKNVEKFAKGVVSLGNLANAIKKEKEARDQLDAERRARYLGHLKDERQGKG